jgi:type II secretory pathway pseudopilin PulG
MATLEDRVRVRMESAEGGFTIVESMMAAGILLIAIVLTITPLAISMRTIDRAKDTTVAENIAQARIEEVRSLAYDDVGNVGYAPDGILARTETRNVSGRDYTVETTVAYVGSLTGLNVVAQGGDGVEGTYDIGVNYKSVVVTVSPVVGTAKPVTMETIVSPPTIGALETVAVVQVDLDLYEPYDPYGDPAPSVQIVGPNTYVSATADLSQYFAGVDLGTYTIQTFGSTNWLIDPVSVSSGATSVDAIGGWNAKRTVRLYQPASLSMTVTDKDTGSPITNAVLTLVDQSSGWTYTGSPGEYSFSDLVPDLYRVTAAASGYATSFVDLDVPGFGGGTSASGTIEMEVQAFTGVDYVFTVNYVGWTDYVINGAKVEVVHPTLGSWIGYTDEYGKVTLNIPASTGSLTATASTSWGHGDAVWSFSTGTGGGSNTLQVGKPSGTDRFRLRYGPVGPNGFYEYRLGGTSGTWVRIPANYLGNVSFIVGENYGQSVELTAFCDTASYPGSPLSSASTTLNNNNKTWSVSPSC